MASLRSRVVRAALRALVRRGKMRERPLPELRRAAERGNASPVPRGVEVRPASADGVPVEWLIPRDADPARVLLYLHGGCFITGSLASHRGWVGRLAAALRARAIHVDYRLAPEHRFPAGLDDCARVYAWLLASGVPPRAIVVAGESAGANLGLALLLSLRERGLPLPAGAVALSPWVDLTNESDSMRQCGPSELFYELSELEWIRELYLADHDPRDPLASPVYGALGGLPPLLIHTTSREMCRDDAVRLAARVQEHGGRAELEVWDGLFHGFQLLAGLPESRLALTKIGAFTERCWPRASA